jgi:hypothetical protein
MPVVFKLEFHLSLLFRIVISNDAVRQAVQAGISRQSDADADADDDCGAHG